MMNLPPDTPQTLSDEDAELLSALADGELAPEKVGDVCALWARDEEARARWHAMHYAGDVARSSDLATAPGHDEAFLQAFRERLAKEPILLAPSGTHLPPSAELGVQSVRLAAPAARRWWGAMAMAAGVAVVTLGVNRMWPADADGVSIAALERPAQSHVAVASPEPAVPAMRPGVVGVRLTNLGQPAAANATAQVEAPTAQMIRDANLDRYLAAHHEFTVPAPMVEPAVSVRQVAVPTGSR